MIAYLIGQEASNAERDSPGAPAYRRPGR